MEMVLHCIGRALKRNKHRKTTNLNHQTNQNQKLRSQHGEKHSTFGAERGTSPRTARQIAFRLLRSTIVDEAHPVDG